MNHGFTGSKSFQKLNPALFGGLHAAESECAEGLPLVGVIKGKETRCPQSQKRYRITFRIFGVRPLDWDNWRTKDAQDCLVEAGYLPDDNWSILEGCVISEKAHTEAEERTEIEIIPLL